MQTAILYNAVKTPDDARKIFGLQVATTDWLKAFLRYSKQEKFPFLIGTVQALEEVQEAMASLGIDPQRLLAYDARFPQENLGNFDAVFRPDPDCRHILWQRAAAPAARFAFCGLAHAVAGWEIGELLEQYCLAPADGNDAIVCPSHAVKAAIRSFWDIYGEYLEQRFGVKFRCDVQLPLIPLGVNVERIAAKVTPDKRAAQRAALGLGANDVAVLWVGRHSHAIKAHPLAMFRAGEEAAKRTGVKVHFLMLGYFVPAEAEAHFKRMAADYCPTAQVSFVANGDPRFPDGLWAAGDIFFSLVDNMQESFGLTPIEAIAAGLPRVISDWDGYRDSVQHGEDGFLVRTLQPPSGTGRELSALLLGNREIYGGFLAKTALSVAVDHRQAADALVKLIESPALRQSMAEKAKRRLPDYAWPTIIAAYEALWGEQAARRKAACVPNIDWPAVPPHAPDPFRMYAAYPTRALRESDRVTITASSGEIKNLWGHEINVLAFDMMIAPDEVAPLINWIAAEGSPSIGSILQQFPTYNRERLWRTLAWMLKLGMVTIP